MKCTVGGLPGKGFSCIVGQFKHHSYFPGNKYPEEESSHMKVLLVNYRFSDALLEKMDELERQGIEGAKKISKIPGLRWKIYLYSDERGETAGVYLFENQESLDAYLNSPIMAQRRAGLWGDGVNQAGEIHDVMIKDFRIMDEMTEITRGPV
jgi:gamma-glutamylcyclotransferase (GGCT)/AIG2-like uncharacterized protein YtfP